MMNEEVQSHSSNFRSRFIILTLLHRSHCIDDLPLTEDTLMTSPDFEMPGKTLFPFSIRA